MPDPDFESILKKYRSLLGPGAASEKNAASSPPADQDLSKSPEESTLSEKTSQAHHEDAYILAERFIRAPLSNEKIDPPSSDIYDNLLFNSLFAAEDGSWDNPGSFIKSVELSDHVEMDPESVEFARRIYHQEMDLRQDYNPDLGMYPGQAFYVPRHVSAHRKPLGKEDFSSLSSLWPDLQQNDETMKPPPPADRFFS